MAIRIEFSKKNLILVHLDSQLYMVGVAFRVAFECKITDTELEATSKNI